VNGARLSAVTFDGRTVEVFNDPGESGLTRMINATSANRKIGDYHEMRWTANNVTVTLNMRLVSDPSVNGDGGAKSKGFQGLRLPETIVGHGAPTPTVASLAGGR